MHLFAFALPALLSLAGGLSLLLAAPGCRAASTSAEPVFDAAAARALAQSAGYTDLLWLLADGSGQRVLEVGGDALEQPRVPASSFKPVLALIALEEGVLASADEVVPWNGERYPTQPRWERVMALDEAMRSSSEPYFRELARRIGRERLAAWLRRIDYGNGQLGEDPARAWIDGELRISPRQQLEFIGRLHSGELPFAGRHREAVLASMREHSDGKRTIYGKTGTQLGSADSSGLGWWVGWVQADGEAHLFVLAVPLQGFDGRGKRLALANALMDASGIPSP